MRERPDIPAARDSTPTEPFDLPEPLPEFLPPLAGDDPNREATYFDPIRWDSEYLSWTGPDERDRVVHDLGRQESSASAALFVSDFHLADGCAGGDDFLDFHLQQDEELGLYTGFAPPGESRAKLFIAVLTFALQRVNSRAQRATRLDLVLNGDVINFLELKGRGGTPVSPKHKLLFRALDVVRDRASVYWLRGNHDYVVPAGPWTAGEFYVNAGLRTLAEHGDVWDKQNWPPGPENKGSQLAIQGASAFEVHAGVFRGGTVKYLMAGIDNLRPWSNDAIEGFLDRRSKSSAVAWLAALVSRLKFLGAADDSAAYKGALQRRQKPYADWLMVQGHTHVPALVPDVYCNTGTWITTLVAPKGKETQIEAFPFLLVYLDPDGRRVVEYYTASYDRPGGAARAALQTAASVNALRKLYGYKALP